MPAFITAAALSLLSSGNKSCTTNTALDLSGEQVAIGMTNSWISITVAAFDFNLYKIPQFTANDRFMMVFQIDHFFFAAIDLFLMGQIIQRNGFLLAQITYIFLVFEDFNNVGIGPVTVSAEG